MLKVSFVNVRVFANTCNLSNSHRQYFLFQYILGLTCKRNKCTIVHCSNGSSDYVLNAIDTMPKRVKSKSSQKTKKLRGSLSPNKRSSFPRSCKSSGKPTFADFNFDFLTSNFSSSKVVMSNNQTKLNSVEKDRKKEKKVEESLKWSSDEELDVVYDVQEEKKNKIYEVITVMSDDETPNEITYERIYADDPKDRIVENPESARQNHNDIVNIEKVDSRKNENGHNSKEDLVSRPVSVITKTENKISKVESDDEVVCVAVIDAKTKAEMKRANVEEICLSSDSESDANTRTVPPIRLKIPAIPHAPNWSMDSLLFNVGNDSSFNVGNSCNDFQFGLRQKYLYPYIIGNKSNVSDSESSSLSPKPVSEFSPTPVNSPQVLSGDESSSSATSESNDEKNVDKFRLIDNENASSTSSSSDEENEIYWKADRESRRKGELMYEEFTKFGKKMHQGEVNIDSEASLSFKVMSYNVLAQKLLEEHRYLYRYHDHRALGWSRRWTLLYNEIKEENPEILCLQEVEETYLISHYAKLHDLGYRWIYKKRTGNYKDGVAVFYKADVFDEDVHYKVEYYQPGVSVLDRDNVGLVVRLRPKKSPSHAIVIATTHLLYNPRRSDVKLAQTQMMLAEIDRLAFDKETLSYFPVILTGDFNLKPRNGVYKLLTEGHLKYEGMSRRSLNPPEDQNILPKVLIPCRLGITDCCEHVDVLNARAKGETISPSPKLYHSEHNRDPKQEDCKDNGFESGSLSHKFNFKSVYSHVKEDGQREASTHHDKWITVDYIFYSTQEGEQGSANNDSPLQLLSRLRLPTQDECERLLRFLPNFAFGSDHLPLVAKFLLRLHYFGTKAKGKLERYQPGHQQQHRQMCFSLPGKKRRRRRRSQRLYFAQGDSFQSPRNVKEKPPYN